MYDPFVPHPRSCVMADARPQALTVRGGCSWLGLTLPFEAALFSFRARQRTPGDLAQAELRDAPIALSRLASVREQPLICLENLSWPDDEGLGDTELVRAVELADGPLTLVSRVPVEWEKRAGELEALSRRTSVALIMAVGWESSDELRSMSEEQLDSMVERLVAAVSEGFGSTPAGERIRAGAFGTLMLRNSPDDSRLLSVLAAAHVRTGAPILCELPACGLACPEAAHASADAASATLDSLRSAGVNMERVLVAHAQHLLRAPDKLHALLHKGIRCAFTGLGMGWCVAGARPTDDPWLIPPDDEVVAQALVGLCRDGFTSQLLLSPCIESRLQMCAFGGAGYTHMQSSFLPRARRLGLTQEDEAFVTRENAARLFAFWVPPPPPERAVKVWECDTCHRRFVEAVNEAEALPEDRPYYEKFSFRYCSTNCLAAHRKASFVQPFSAPPPPV